MRHTGWVEHPPHGLIRVGPLVDVVLAPHPTVVKQIMSAGGTPPRLETRLMVDTGAEHTLVEIALLQSLTIRPHRHLPMVGVSQKPEMSPVYLMSIGLTMENDQKRPEAAVFVNEVVGMPSPSTPDAQCHGLLGRDFLSHFHLVYDGPTGTFEIQLPGSEAEKPLSRQERRRLERKGK